MRKSILANIKANFPFQIYHFQFWIIFLQFSQADNSFLIKIEKLFQIVVSEFEMSAFFRRFGFFSVCSQESPISFGLSQSS